DLMSLSERQSSRSRLPAGSPGADDHRRAVSAGRSVAARPTAPRLDDRPPRPGDLKHTHRLAHLRRRRIVPQTVVVQRVIQRTRYTVAVVQDVERSRTPPLGHPLAPRTLSASLGNITAGASRTRRSIRSASRAAV